MKEKKPLNKLDKYLIFSVTALIIYTIVEQVLTSIYGFERSTLTTCFYGAFGGEILSCVVIKVFNIKNIEGKEGTPEEPIPEDKIEFFDIGGEG